MKPLGRFQALQRWASRGRRLSSAPADHFSTAIGDRGPSGPRDWPAQGLDLHLHDSEHIVTSFLRAHTDMSSRPPAQTQVPRSVFVVLVLSPSSPTVVFAALVLLSRSFLQTAHSSIVPCLVCREVHSPNQQLSPLSPLSPSPGLTVIEPLSVPVSPRQKRSRWCGRVQGRTKDAAHDISSYGSWLQLQPSTGNTGARHTRIRVFFALSIHWVICRFVKFES